jgi:hypothetical protein
VLHRYIETPIVLYIVIREGIQVSFKKKEMPQIIQDELRTNIYI